MDKKPRLIRIVSAVILACGLTVTVLLAQDDFDTLRRAAEQGDAFAQRTLGAMHSLGRGVLKDSVLAYKTEKGTVIFLHQSFP